MCFDTLKEYNHLWTTLIAFASLQSFNVIISLWRLSNYDFTGKYPYIQAGTLRGGSDGGKGDIKNIIIKDRSRKCKWSA